MGDIDEAVGQRIRATRLAAGLSQGELGARIGVSAQQVQKYENAQNRISASRLMAVARVLGVAPGHFFEALTVAEAAAEGDLLSDRRALSLLRAFARMPEPQKSALLHMAESMGGAGDGAGHAPPGH